jgi:hypothetical protein
MGAYKKLEGRMLYVDMSKIHVPSWKIREVQKAAHEKTRALKKIDPFARCVGRKRIFETPDQLRAACNAYFKDQEYVVLNKWGKPMIDPETGEYIKGTKPLTLAGLGRHVGVATSTLRRYRAVAESGTIPYEFAEVMMEALQKIEEYAERRGYDRDGQRGSQFVLQAGFNWQTRKEASERCRIRTDQKIALEKLKMQQEEHRLKMKMLEAGLEGDAVDNDITVTIKRAQRDIKEG